MVAGAGASDQLPVAVGGGAAAAVAAVGGAAQSSTIGAGVGAANPGVGIVGAGAPPSAHCNKKIQHIRFHTLLVSGYYRPSAHEPKTMYVMILHSHMQTTSEQQV